MFRRRNQDLLPVASGTRGTGLRASEVMSAPKLTSGQRTSLIIFAISAVLVFIGYLFCAFNQKAVTLECVRGADCRYRMVVGDPERDMERTFPADNLKSGSATRMKQGVEQDTSGMKRRRQRKLQHGYRVTYLDGPELVATHLQMSTWNLGRKRPKAQVEEVEKWILGNKSSMLLKESTFVSVSGIICMCVGGVGALLSLLIGCVLDDEPHKRPRRRYQPRKARQ